MMQSFRFGRVFGIPLEARVSFFVMLAAVLLFMGGLSGIFLVLLAFSSVILHELGHALVARKLGVGVSGIELHFFGGVAKLMSQPRSDADEVKIAAAGPAVSFVLAGLGFLLYFATGLGFFQLLGAVNLVIAVFNLIPALPMDGGRIMRALLSHRIGFRRATHTAVKVSRVVSIAFGVIGLAFFQIQLMLLAVVLWFMASAELRQVQPNTGAFEQGPFDQHVEHHNRHQPSARGSGHPPGPPPRVIVIRRHWRSPYQ